MFFGIRRSGSIALEQHRDGSVCAYVIMAYQLFGKALMAYRRRRRKKS
jgi:hypothetical protein